MILSLKSYSLALGMAPLSDISLALRSEMKNKLNLDFVVNRIQPKHIEIIKAVPKKKNSNDFGIMFKTKKE